MRQNNLTYGSETLPTLHFRLDNCLSNRVIPLGLAIGKDALVIIECEMVKRVAMPNRPCPEMTLELENTILLNSQED